MDEEGVGENLQLQEGRFGNFDHGPGFVGCDFDGFENFDGHEDQRFYREEVQFNEVPMDGQDQFEGFE